MLSAARFAAILLLLGGCTLGTLQPQRAPAPPPPDLPAVFDCLRERGLALVSAHRGQPDPSAAENSLDSFTRTARAGPLLIETDIRRTADGVLVLMHDETLDRTTTASGRVDALPFAEVRRARLTDGQGRMTDEPVPTLDEALVWAKRRGAILQLDIKPGVPLSEVVEHVRRAGMESQVILIAYTLEDVRAARAAAPDMMISASGRTAAEIRAIEGLAGPRLLLFAGTREPDPALLARFARLGVEVILGTLGRPGERLDDLYLADGDGRGYADLAARGVQLIASDQPVRAWEALRANRRDGSICLPDGGRSKERLR
jgi:glycerophosphoryl diester phosphodiesterase